MKIVIIIAMDYEYQNMVSIFDGRSEGEIAGNHIILMKSGIGKVNAAVKTAEIIAREHPDCIINTGLAGGIDKCLEVRDIVVGKETVYHDVWCGEGNEYGQVQGLPARFAGDRRLHDIAMSLSADSSYTQRMHSGLICSGDKFITNAEALAVIKNDFPEGLAVDMESAATAQTCYLYHVPFLAVRIISDTPGRTDNHQQQWEDFLKDMSTRSFRWIRLFLAALPNDLG